MRDETFPAKWTPVPIEECLLPYPNGKRIRQGWSPQCEKFPARTLDDWGVLRTSSIQDGYFVDEENKHLPSKLAPKTHLEVEEGDILITCAGPRSRCGVACLVRSTRPKLLISGKMYQLRTDSEIVDCRLLELFLREPRTKQRIDELKTGINDSGLNLTHDRFKTLQVPLPPLAEQQRIVAKIEELFSELDAGEESLRRARRQLGVYRQSLLKQAFEGKLTATWRTQHPELLESPEQLLARIQAERQQRYQQQLKEWEKAGGGRGKPNKPTPLRAASNPGFPCDSAREHWLSTPLGNLIEEPAYGTSKKCSYEAGSTGVLRIPNVVNGAIDSEDLKFADFSREERETYALTLGDLLMIRSNGSVSIVGRCAVVEEKHKDLLYAGYLIRLRPLHGVIDPRFLLSQLSSTALRSQIEFSAKSTSGVNNINSKEIQRLELALPSLPEQQEIVRLLDAQFEVIEQNEREIDAALKRSEALRQSILKKAFSGQLVPQDPADEPASVLLKRIREGRNAAPKASRSTRNPIATK